MLTALLAYPYTAEPVSNQVWKPDAATIHSERIGADYIRGKRDAVFATIFPAPRDFRTSSAADRYLAGFENFSRR
jgi:hypothetical protein